MDDLDHECIICTLDLAVINPADDLGNARGATPINSNFQLPAQEADLLSNDNNSINGEKKSVAVIKPCNHFLHDECLREWSQIANTCPLCRQAFNLVEVHNAIGGTLISSYTVQDKKQVAIIDSNSWLEEEQEDETHPCPICNDSGHPEILLLCDACDANYHTYCVGLDDIPIGDWFCLECVNMGTYSRVDDSATDTVEPYLTRGRRAPRTQASVRRNRQRLRNDSWLGPWSQIGHRIHGATGLDIDFSEDEDVISWRRTNQDVARQESQRNVWRLRLNIARRQGAAWAFRAAAPALLPRDPTPIESVEESMAWGEFEKAKEIDTGSPKSRKRKLKFSTAAPAVSTSTATDTQPGRKLKRPRTRIVLDRPESSLSSTITGPYENSQDGASSNHSPIVINEEPSFLSSLLKEVDMASRSDDGRINQSLVTVPTSNRATSPLTEYSSPLVSTVSPSQTTPRALSSTPPPFMVRRSISPLPLTSRIEPIFPPAEYFLNQATSATNMERSKARRAELRQPRPRRNQPKLPRLVHQSTIMGSSHPTVISPSPSSMSIETKADISRIVKSALEPHWNSAEITKEQYGQINRDVSRKLYNILADQNLSDEKEKRRCKKIATAEVEIAVNSLTA
ncbi:hypothetical protein/PHD and RING finger domain-containing protein [Blumeria hordei DH14]|uniref:PHD and RING finger domain-containing protein n=1 Tax=Blumeria graminis f. sp. hordei (strain DH14) TaxID=546991 RepID=N1JL34_BLUG1|nr:hypothetical protein/PHD and RING finger domain-containing protein [Blumeria hordei DH14]